jgi:hypothetical protein
MEMTEGAAQTRIALKIIIAIRAEVVPRTAKIHLIVTPHPRLPAKCNV